MRTLFLGVLAASICCTAACAPRKNIEELGPASADEFAGMAAFDVATASKAAHIPEEFKAIQLPSASKDGLAVYAVMPWRSYVYHRRHRSLGYYQGANITDLLAFQAAHGARVSTYKGVCAPISFMDDGTSWRAVLSRGNSFGIWQGGCQWALVVRDVAPYAPDHSPQNRT